MSAHQVELLLVMGSGVFATAIGYGWIDLGTSETLDKQKRWLRWLGPLLAVGNAGLFIATLWS